MPLNDKYLVPYLNKLKRKDFPKSPKTVDALISAFEDEETKNFYGKYYIHTQNGIPGQKYAFTILSDRNVLRTIAKRGPYQQLLIIHLAYEKEVITKI